MSPGLQVRGLRFGYHRSREVLRGIDLEVAPGEVVALLGPNGGGKSTLLRAVTALVRPWEGQIRWRARDLAGLGRVG